MSINKKTPPKRGLVEKARNPAEAGVWLELELALAESSAGATLGDEYRTAGLVSPAVVLVLVASTVTAVETAVSAVLVSN